MIKLSCCIDGTDTIGVDRNEDRNYVEVTTTCGFITLTPADTRLLAATLVSQAEKLEKANV